MIFLETSNVYRSLFSAQHHQNVDLLSEKAHNQTLANQITLRKKSILP